MIQESINEALENAIQNKVGGQYLSNIRLLKAEMQRVKTKVLTDKQATEILVRLIKSQGEVVRELTDRGGDPVKIEEANSFIALAKTFLEEEVLSQISMTRDDLEEWISRNIDFTTIKSKVSAIGIVKKTLPYVDGDVVKNILMSM